MTTQKQKFISDRRLKKSEDNFLKMLDGLGVDNLKAILDSQPGLLYQRDSNTGLTLLYHSVLNGNYQVAECLLEYKADPNITNSYGESILHQAVENGNHKIINLLLENGADPNIQQESGETPMHVAASKGDYKVLKLLLLYRADPLIRTYEGYTALDYAKERGYQKCIDVLTPVLNERIYEISGMKTTKNSESPLNRMKNQVDLLGDKWNSPDINLFSAKNSRNQLASEESMRMYSQKKGFAHRFLTASNTNINSFDDSYFSIGNPQTGKKLSCDKDRYQSNNYSSYLHNADQFNQYTAFAKRYTQQNPLFPNLSMNNDICSRNQTLDTPRNHKMPSNDSMSHKAMQIEDKLNKQIKDFIGDLSKHYLDSEEQDTNKDLNGNTGNFQCPESAHQNRYASEKNTEENPIDEGEFYPEKKRASTGTITSNATSAFANYATFSNSQTNKGSEIQQRSDNNNNNHKRNNSDDSPKNFSLHIEENRQLTLHPNECDEPEQSSTNVKEGRGGLNVSGGFTFNNIEVNANQDERMCNLPLQRGYIGDNPMKNSKYSFANEYYETMTEYWRQIEDFQDKGKVLALFMSAKNDIIEIHKSTMVNPLTRSNQLRNSNVKEQGETGKKIEELFDFNMDEVNEYAYDHNKNSDYEDDNFTEEKQNDEDDNKKVLQLNSQSLSKAASTSHKRENSIKYFSKSTQVKNDRKQISIDTEKLDEDGEMMYQKSPEVEKSIEYHSTEASKDVGIFLKSIGMDMYTSLLIQQGFDDVKLIIDQMASGIGITDQNLREAGVTLPGHRARILIRFEEESKCFDFALPAESVYYRLGSKLTDMMSDHHVKCIQTWLSHLKLEQYTFNFVNGGYHSMELLLLQMSSKNPITEKILEDEIKIAKIGYRIRIINKLKEDSRAYIHKLRTAGLNIESKKDLNNDSCKCLVF